MAQELDLVFIGLPLNGLDAPSEAKDPQGESSITIGDDERFHINKWGGPQTFWHWSQNIPEDPLEDIQGPDSI